MAPYTGKLSLPQFQSTSLKPTCSNAMSTFPKEAMAPRENMHQSIEQTPVIQEKVAIALKNLKFAIGNSKDVASRHSSMQAFLKAVASMSEAELLQIAENFDKKNHRSGARTGHQCTNCQVSKAKCDNGERCAPCIKKGFLCKRRVQLNPEFQQENGQPDGQFMQNVSPNDGTFRRAKKIAHRRQHNIPSLETTLSSPSTLVNTSSTQEFHLTDTTSTNFDVREDILDSDDFSFDDWLMATTAQIVTETPEAVEAIPVNQRLLETVESAYTAGVDDSMSLDTSNLWESNQMYVECHGSKFEQECWEIPIGDVQDENKQPPEHVPGYFGAF